jgi:hypothetical protein
MSMEDIRKILSLDGVREKIFKIKEMYNPRLIANLSKEASDIYLVRKSIWEDLQKLLDEKDINIVKVKDFIKEQIKKSKTDLKQAQNDEDINFLKITVKEWEEFL